MALFGLGLLILAYPPSAFERSLQRFLASIPGWLDPVWGFLSDLPWLWACLLVIVALARRRFFVAGQAAGSFVLAIVVGIVSARLAAGAWPHLSDSIFGTSHAPGFPGTRLAEASAVMLAVVPHFVRPVRVVDRWILVLGIVGTAAAGGVTPSGTLASVLVGIVAAASVRLATGTSIGRPGIDAVSAGLAQLGVVARDLQVADHQVAGVFLVRGVDASGEPLLVKVYGRDAYDTQFIAKLWRSISYRGSGTRIRTGRLESAQHEALVSLLAENGGVPTRGVVTVGATVDDDALLVLRGPAQPLGALPESELDGAYLRGAWRAMHRLDERRIAHGQIDGNTLALVEREVGFVDFADAIVAPDADTVSASRAQLLMTTAALFGSTRALEAGIEELGAPGVEELLPHLQDAALGRALRRQLKESDIDVDEFRQQAADALGVEAPGLAKLRRVSPRAVLQIVLLGLAAYAIVGAAGDVNWSEFTSTLGSATWGWIVFGFIVAQLPRLTQALATIGSVPASLPYGPVYALQLATGYMNVALPSHFARMAVSIRFFQRQGLSAPVAIASGTVDSFASTVVQAVLLGLLLIFSESSLAFDLPFPEGGTRVLLFVLIGAVLLVVVAVLLVRRVRRLITENVRRWWPEIKSALTNLRSSNKLALLLLGSLATEVLFAIALGLFTRSFGYDISFAELLVINISVALLGSIVPVPGNIGVAEFGLSIGLVSAGMTDQAAIAAVLLYRISTFYLPPVWGFFAMLWLQRNRYL